MSRVPFLLTILGIFAAYFVGSINGVFVCVLLAVLEVSLSFDNAVVNATILEQMTPVWRRRFLTWGILIAVFGMRLVFPFVLVHLLSGLDPRANAELPISAFGGFFLLLVSLRHFSVNRRHLWLAWPERALALLGRLPQSELALALLLLLALRLPPLGLTAGLFGIITFIVVSGLTAWTGTKKAHASLGLFVYLEVLDASFSLDSVIGAFALTQNLILIAIGLGIGAIYVRSLTMLIVEKNVLADFDDLEQGAYWAILSLAISMLVDIYTPVPEAVTGLAGGALILLAIATSFWKQRRRTRTKAPTPR